MCLSKLTSGSRFRQLAALLILASLIDVSGSRLLKTAAAQAPSVREKNEATLRGIVSDASGRPVSSAVVRLELRDGDRAVGVRETPTDSFSKYSFSALRTGTYSIVACKSGLCSRTVIFTVSGDSRQELNLILNLKDDSLVTSSSSQAIEFSDSPNFTIAGVTDWTAVGGHGSDSTLRTTEDLARETLTLESKGKSQRLSAPPTAERLVEEEEQLRAALEADPDGYEQNRNLGSYYLRTAQFERAVPLLETAARIGHAQPEDEYNLALACQGIGDYKQARQHVEQALAHQDTAQLHRLAGDLDEKLGDPLAAVQQDERAVRLDPSEGNYFAWGSELLLHRAVWQAVEVFSDGANTHPASARLLTGWGSALFAGGLYEKAAQKLCEASDLNPADPYPYIFMGRLEQSTPESLPCVEPELARFLQEQPANANANYLYAMAIYKRQDRDDLPHVERLLERALALDPGYAQAYLQLGIIAVSRRDYHKAIEYYRKAIDADPQLGEAHYRLGVAYDRTGDPSNAKQQFQIHDELDKAQADAVEQQRREVKQFLVSQKQKSGPENH